MIPGFGSACEQWQSRCRTEGVIEDVYDGNILKEFQICGDRPFLSDPFAFGLTMTGSNDTNTLVGAIMNLPHNLRYKREIILLVGIIPGPHEPSRVINLYLDPLVQEMLHFWDGIHLDVHGYHKIFVRCALLCLACDQPAGRKAAGFLVTVLTLPVPDA